MANSLIGLLKQFAAVKRTNRVSGVYPRKLYRFFDQEKYAAAFLRGQLRIWQQARYADALLASRTDDREGTSHYVKGGVEHHGSFTNQIFVLCCSLPGVDIVRLKEKFGIWVIVIHNPVELAIDLDCYLNGDGTKPGIQIVGAEVEYTKGLEVPKDTIKQRLVELALTQKAKSYQEECEFRYCLVDMSHRGSMESIDIDFGTPLTYAEMLT